MAASEPKSGRAFLFRPGSGRYYLLVLFWIIWGWMFLLGLPPVPFKSIHTTIVGPPVIDSELVEGWVAGIPFRTFPFLDQNLLETLKINHPWIESVSEKKVPGLGRAVLVKVWSPIAILRPAYGLLGFGSPAPKARPDRVSFLTNQGLSLLGNPFPGSGTLPQVILKSPMTREVGRRLVKTIQTVQACRGNGAPDGRWYSLNGPHEIRFYPGHNLPVLLLGTDLGCAPFKLFRSFMERSSELSPGRMPEGIDLRFSGMLLLRPTLDPAPPLSPPKISVRS